MVVGDVINEVFANSIVSSFRPAATVGVIITSWWSQTSGAPEYLSLTDGVNTAFMINNVSNVGTYSTKFMINNNVWITTRTTTFGGSYTGLQIQ